MSKVNIILRNIHQNLKYADLFYSVLQGRLQSPLQKQLIQVLIFYISLDLKEIISSNSKKFCVQGWIRQKHQYRSIKRIFNLVFYRKLNNCKKSPKILLNLSKSRQKCRPSFQKSPNQFTKFTKIITRFPFHHPSSTSDSNSTMSSTLSSSSSSCFGW